MINIDKGPVMFLISSFLFAVMGVFLKLASSHVPVNEIAFVRFLVGIIVALALAKSGIISLASDRKLLLAARGIFSGLAILFFFAAVKWGTLTNAIVLNGLYPVFATVFAAVYLKEKLSPAVVLSLVISMAGIFLLTHPSITSFRTGDLLALASSVFAGISVIIIRELRRTESAWAVFFYLTISGAVFSGLLAFPNLVLPDIWGIILVFLVTFFGTMGQVTMIWAYKYCTASVGSVLSMSTVVFAAFFGLVFLGEKLTSIEALGAVMIVLSSAYIAYRGTSEQKDLEGREMA